MRIGVYVCHCGGNISEVVDVKKVAALMGEQADVTLARDYEHMCSEAGQKIVLDDIAEHNLDRIVIAACSPQFHEKTFRATLVKAGLNPYMLEIANIREQCSWPHFDYPDYATLKAKDLTNIAVAKVRLDEPLGSKAIPIGKRVLVIGGGIAGIQASLDLGDAGFQVYLVEKEPSIGGKMAQLSRTFPTEDCSACILSPKMADVPANSNITMLTNSEVVSINGYVGNFEATIHEKPRYVDVDKCVTCRVCEEKCPVKVPDEFQEGMKNRKAIYVPFDFAVPYRHLIDESVCLRLTKGGEVCGLCQKVCPHDAVDFNQQPRTHEIVVDTIIVATGYDVFDARLKKAYGFGKYENVINGLQMERIISCDAEGKPLRDIGKRIAFIQCVGSRDEQVGNEYCSRICCMYATKLSQLLKRADPSREVYVFYTDLRSFGKGFEEYYKRAQDTGVKFVRGRPAELTEDRKTKKITIKVEDTLSRQMLESEFDLVVLSTGMVPSQGTESISKILRLNKSPDGFLREAHPKFKPVDTLQEGVFVAGTVQGPKDIPDTVAQASAAASRAIRLMNQGELEAEPITAQINEDLCGACGTCVSVCPYDALKLVEKEEKKVAECNEVLCKGCGSCAGACPTGAAQQKHFKTTMIRAMLDAALGVDATPGKEA
ncbi:CoB--CoM heterodisulfide reductase iron-sulfur subunit A family protein [candidate division WOR-3 bacterium]|nr:CoB--CoM heterodisulfide reductase iron-sulfur subunit A family protein [candidate division WOR-3 bacterium]